MGKTAFEYIDGKYYRLADTPSLDRGQLIECLETKNIMTFNESESRVISSITLNTINCCELKTNSELYNEFVSYLRKKRIRSLDRVYNRFMVYLDYSIYNRNGEEVKHDVASHEIIPDTTLYPLGVSEENELVYHVARLFNPTIEFTTKNKMPYGIMDTGNKKSRYTMMINDISIYQDKIDRVGKHLSSQGNCYKYGSHTIRSSLENMVLVYSTNDNGISIQSIDVPYIPKKITLSIKILIDNMFIAYDDAEVDQILAENIDTPDIIIPSGPVIPEGDIKPIADGNMKPDENGFSDYYELARSTTPEAYKVVYDDIPDSEYDVHTMIRKYMVIADLPYIQIGDYVRYMKTLEISHL